MAMRAQEMDRSLVGDFAFPQAALAFETESLRAVAPHFAQLNAGPAEFSIDPHSPLLAHRQEARMTRQTAPIISGLVAAIAAFIVWLLFDNSFASSLIFGVIAGVLAFGVSYFQYRNRA